MPSKYCNFPVLKTANKGKLCSHHNHHHLRTLNYASNLVLFSSSLITLKMIVLIVILYFQSWGGKACGCSGGVGVCSGKRQYN